MLQHFSLMSQCKINIDDLIPKASKPAQGFISIFISMNKKPKCSRTGVTVQVCETWSCFKEELILLTQNQPSGYLSWASSQEI